MSIRRGSRGTDCSRRSATYALDRLDDAGELVAARDAHAEFWAGWAEEHNVHFDCSPTILDAIPANLANLTAAARWACVSRPELLQPLMLCIGPFVQLEDGERSAEGLFESALAALEGRDDIAWAHVAMAAESARSFTWVVVADEQLRVRAAALAAEHDLVLIRAHLAFTSAAIDHEGPRRLRRRERAVRRGRQPDLGAVHACPRSSLFGGDRPARRR